MIWFEEEPPISPTSLTAGALAMGSLLFLAVAVFLLWRSLRKQMTKIDPELPKGAAEERFDAEQIPEEPDSTPGA